MPMDINVDNVDFESNGIIHNKTKISLQFQLSKQKLNS